ncbi:MAG: hypothetical protein OIF51_04575 [Cellvibrionaceae bacterium]|nr:hypothetical protein [Cellvibrionaceae bacterium]
MASASPFFLPTVSLKTPVLSETSRAKGWCRLRNGLPLARSQKWMRLGASISGDTPVSLVGSAFKVEFEQIAY